MMHSGIAMQATQTEKSEDNTVETTAVTLRYMPIATWRQVKARAALSDRELGKIVNEALEAWLAKQE